MGAGSQFDYDTVAPAGAWAQSGAASGAGLAAGSAPALAGTAGSGWDSRDPHTPVAIIEQGTTADQRTITGTLADIAAIAQAQGVRAPAVIVVGEVAALHHQLRWFDPAATYQTQPAELFAEQPTFVGN